MSFDERHSEHISSDAKAPSQDDWEELRRKASSDMDGYPPFYDFKGPGDTLEGQIEKFRWGEINPDNPDREAYDELFVTILTIDGDLVTYGFNRSYLIRRWKALDPHPGDLIRVTYEGQDDNSNAHKYSVSLKRMRGHENSWKPADDYLKGRDMFKNEDNNSNVGSGQSESDKPNYSETETEDEDDDIPF